MKKIDRFDKYMKYKGLNDNKNARFHTDFGRFLCVFGNGNRVQQKQNEARRQNRASTLFPGDEPGLSQQCG